MRALRFFKADPHHFDLVFVANATAGIKLVMEGFRGSPAGFWYGYHRDAHTSLIGVRENAMEHRCFGDDAEVADWMQSLSRSGAPPHRDPIGLFAYPAQSNLNGRRLPLSWPCRLRHACQSGKHNVYSLLDAAALVSTSPLDLSDPFQAPDFTVLSFYKIFGFPDLGALIVRKKSAQPLCGRKYFGGGTVEVVTCTNESWHIKKQNSIHEQLEDGTLPIHAIVALDAALDLHVKLFGSLARITSHTSFLANNLYRDLSALRHGNGRPVCTIYQDPRSSYEDPATQGPIIALNIQNSKGEWISTAEVEKLATIKNIQLRTGGLCNPAGVSSFLGLQPSDLRRNFVAGQRCGNDNDIQGGKPTGVIRVSLGAMSNIQDVTAFVRFVEEFFVDSHCPSSPSRGMPKANADFYVESLYIYPIKSCGAWQIPSYGEWDIKPEGLAWDREWCLVHQGTREALSQKRIPRMALIRPTIDFESGVLRIRYDGHLPPSTPSQVTVPLFDDPTAFLGMGTQCRGNTCPPSRVCGDLVSACTYNSLELAAFFTAALSTPCTLARFPPGPSSTRHSKLHLQQPKHQPLSRYSPSEQSIPGAFPPTPPRSPPPTITATAPILLSNESPILTITRPSLNHLNSIITAKSPTSKPAPTSAFRANILLACSSPQGNPIPYDEDNWSSLHVLTTSSPSAPPSSVVVGPQNDRSSNTVLDVLAPCHRCGMVCINQETAARAEEPFVTLAKTRRRRGKVVFGVHCCLRADGGGRRTIRVGDRVVVVRRGEGEGGDGDGEGDGDG